MHLANDAMLLTIINLYKYVYIKQDSQGHIAIIKQTDRMLINFYSVTVPWSTSLPERFCQSRSSQSHLWEKKYKSYM